jgi:outer membrane protein assembly factor BamB
MKMKHVWLLGWIYLWSLGAGCLNFDNPTEDDVILRGGAQKGPFIMGSAVDAYPVDELGEAISGDSFHTETMSDQGDFKLVLPESGPVLLEAQGYYYNEVRGALSTSQLTLRALVYVSEAVEQDVYVNLVTHLTRDRIKKLLAQGKELNQAVIQAELELVRNLGLGGSDFSAGATGVHMNLLGGNTLDNAYLFALGSVLTQAAALQGQGDAALSDAHLQELLNQMSKLMEDGESFPVELFTLLRQAEATLDTQEVEDAFQARLDALNLDVEVPDLDQTLDQDHDGIINNQDNCPHYYNPEQHADDCACNVCSSGDVKCEQGGIYSCQQIEGCWQWVGPLACSSGICQDSQSCGCDNTCDFEGQLACYDDTLHRCIRDIDGCLTFDAGTICPDGCADTTSCNVNCVPTNTQYSSICHDNAEWWVDDCGIEGNKKIDCECGCNESNSDCKSQQYCELSGTLKWAFDTGGAISSPAIGADGTIYVGSNDTNLYAINPDGIQKWQFDTGLHITSSPSIGADGTIYIGSWDNKLYAINPDGSKKWDFTTGDFIFASASIGVDGTIYIGSMDNKLYAINPDGSVKWYFNFEIGSIIKSPPSIGADGIIYFSIESHVWAIYPENGVVKWANHTFGNNSPPAIGVDGTIYVGSYDYHLYALDPDGNIKWKFATGDRIESSPVVGTDGTIYIGSTDNKIYAIYPDGSKKWEFETLAGFCSSPALGMDGTIIVGSKDNKLYAINSDGSLKWSYETGNSICSSPAIDADGTVYVGSHDHKLYVINDDNGGLADSPWPKFGQNNQNTGRLMYDCASYTDVLEDLLLITFQGIDLSEDTSNWPAGVETTCDRPEAIEWINGHTETFFKHGWIALGREAYTIPDFRIKIYINAMYNQQSATLAFEEAAAAWYQPSEYVDYGGDNGLYSLQGKIAYAVGTKDKYFVEISVEPQDLINGECDGYCEMIVTVGLGMIFNKIP